jgi:protein-S-isoprenylcysteine O-methyltransferase Ste14
MDKEKILSHILMWILIGSGVGLVFLFIPSGAIFLQNQKLFYILIIFLSALLFYHLVASIYFRCKIKKKSRGEKKLIEAGVYGRFSHPTCISAVIFFWIVFLFFPDTRVFVSVIFTTIVVICWIEIEKAAHRKDKDSFDNEINF